MKNRTPWAWIPTLYFAEGLPYVAVMTLSVIMYKKLDLSNAEIALYTSWLYLPWVIKPFWSPFVDLIKTKRWWIYTMQLLTGAGLAGVAFSIPGDFFWQASLSFFWLLAFSSATHDIAADGFYMLALSTSRQAFFIGIRNTFYRIAMVTGQGLLVMLAGYVETRTGRIPYAWSIVFLILSGVFVAACAWHRFILPLPLEDRQRSGVTPATILREFIKAFADFFRKKGIVAALLFMLTYRLGESQLVKLASPFLLDARERGGLSLSTAELGLAYGTVGVVSLMLGGILGGVVIARLGGLRRWIWPMALSLFLPNLAYVYMAYALPDNLFMISVCVGFEQLGYGFGFTAYTMYLMLFSDGPYKTSHYAISTGFMALGLMLPGMFSGWIQQATGYPLFFLWVLVCSLPVFFVIPFLKGVGGGKKGSPPKSYT
ncbi:MAG: MFS transporter [Tannerellaceae bacterium]|jgi:PAT family beta-lactamase induction signal transducer AmpG|nr:MFS transporter [Tannerellaceae bacterium]